MTTNPQSMGQNWEAAFDAAYSNEMLRRDKVLFKDFVSNLIAGARIEESKKSEMITSDVLEKTYENGFKCGQIVERRGCSDAILARSAAFEEVRGDIAKLKEETNIGDSLFHGVTALSRLDDEIVKRIKA